MLEIGLRFGRLTIVGSEMRTLKSGKRRRFYLCSCDCGGTSAVAAYSLQGGNSTTCGCLQKEVAAARLRTHGDASEDGARAAEYSVWAGMLDRCRNPNNKQFKDYGGRGIRVCDRWASSYQNFLSDMGRKPFPSATIDRQNNERGYEPGNCVWETRARQNRNRRDVQIVEYQGRQMPLPDACDLAGLKTNTVIVRLRRGWSLEQALTTTL